MKKLLKEDSAIYYLIIFIVIVTISVFLAGREINARGKTENEQIDGINVQMGLQAKEIIDPINVHLSMKAELPQEIEEEEPEVEVKQEEPVKEEKQTPNVNELKLIQATAYYDSYGHGYGAIGSPLVEGITIAGRRKDLGKTAFIYDLNYNLIGIYQFQDTGYGQETGWGQSSILLGRTVGTIEAGQCVDIYMTTYAKCKSWGRRNVYIQIVDAKG